jgi:hypothetical protein
VNLWLPILLHEEKKITKLHKENLLLRNLVTLTKKKYTVATHISENTFSYQLGSKKNTSFKMDIKKLMDYTMEQTPSNFFLYVELS